MVITNLIGGLGNQMFQYAAGLALADKHNGKILVDITGFHKYKEHNGYELSKLFKAGIQIATHDDLRNLLGWRSSEFVRSNLRRAKMAKFRGKNFIVEPYFHYWENFDSLSSDSYLVGYWQSPKYFETIVKRLREDFTFKIPLSVENQFLLDKITKKNSVSLHVRRGDYVINTKNKSIYEELNKDYYYRAIGFISERIHDPLFVVFSDDPNWVLKNIKLPDNTIYVNHNSGSESYNDMRIMSHCNHNIIANSTFSWWGAWLNANHEKIVIAPDSWFINSNDVKDLFPDEWVRL